MRHKGVRRHPHSIADGVVQIRKNRIVDRLADKKLIQLFLCFAVPLFHQFQVCKFYFVVKAVKCAFAHHRLNPFLRNGVTALEGLHHRVFPVNELLVPIDFAIFIFCEVRIQLGNGTAVFRRNLIFLIAQSFTQLFEESRCVNQLNLAFALRTLILGEDPDVCSDACVIKQIGGQRNDGFNQIAFQHPASNLTLAGSCSTGE